jgi:hypothetical protein
MQHCFSTFILFAIILAAPAQLASAGDAQSGYDIAGASQSVRRSLMRLWLVLIVSAVLFACSKTPPNGAANLPSAGSTAAVSSPTARSVPDQTGAPEQTGGGCADTRKPAALSEAKQSSAGVRPDAQSGSLEKDCLMAALFPGWKSSNDSSSGAPTPGDESTAARATQDSPAHVHVDRVPHIEGGYMDDLEDLGFDAEPWGVVRLDELHAALITYAHAGWTPGAGRYDIVGTYFFTNHDAVWHLSKSVDVATWGVSNQSNELKTERWSGHGFVLSLITESGEQGANTSDVDMTLLSPDKATHLLHASLAESDGASGSLEDDMAAYKDGISCGDLESDDFKLPPTDKLESGETECRSANGHWSFDGDLIRFTYEGVGRKVNKEGNVLPLTRWKSTATYRWENQTVKLVEGKDPEFGY